MAQTIASASTAPKRKRPSFNPPRPTATTSKTAASVSKPASKAKTNPKKTTRARSPIAVDDDDSDIPLSPSPVPSEEEEDDDQEEEEDAAASDENNSASPEPDFILAEISHPSSSLSDAHVPLDLLHRILHEHFARPEETKVSKDAKELVGKYVDVFVREAIARCAYEVQGKQDGYEDGEDGGNEGGGGRKDDGWLEVDDLEKVAVQLLLDF